MGEVGDQVKYQVSEEVEGDGYHVQILPSLGEEQVRQAQQAQDGLVGVTSCPGA